MDAYERWSQGEVRLYSSLIFEIKNEVRANYSGRKAARVKVLVALSNSFLFLGSRWAER